MRNGRVSKFFSGKIVKLKIWLQCLKVLKFQPWVHWNHYCRFNKGLEIKLLADWLVTQSKYLHRKNVVTRIAGKQNFTLDICNPDLRTESRNTFKEFRLQILTKLEQNRTMLMSFNERMIKVIQGLRDLQ